MINITVDKTELARLTKTLHEGIESLSNWSRPFGQFGVLLRQEQKKNFETGGAIYNGGDFVRLGGAFANLSKATTRSSRWSPLAESTQKDRARKGYGAKSPILVRSGKLKQSFTTKITPKTFTSENTSGIAIYHQAGTNKMPARRVIGLSKKSIKALSMAMEKHIAGAFKMSAHNNGFVIIK